MQLFTAGVEEVLGAQQEQEVLGGRVYGAAVVDRVDNPLHRLQLVVLLFSVDKVGVTEETLALFPVEAVRVEETLATVVQVQQGTSE
jgi:hypothetical protein